MAWEQVVTGTLLRGWRKYQKPDGKKRRLKRYFVNFDQYIGAPENYWNFPKGGVSLVGSAIILPHTKGARNLKNAQRVRVRVTDFDDGGLVSVKVAEVIGFLRSREETCCHGCMFGQNAVKASRPKTASTRRGSAAMPSGCE